MPWFAGEHGLGIPRADRRGWAERLAAGLGSLHIEPTANAPINPVRGVPRAARDTVIVERLRMLRTAGVTAPRLLDGAETAWRAGLTAPAWTRAPVWIHGDLHPGNLIARGGELVAIVDFGDVTAGDPAHDLAVAWLAFDGAGRAAFRAATGSRYDDATWVRARAWSAAIGVLLLSHSDDSPAYAALATAALAELTRAA